MICRDCIPHQKPDGEPCNPVFSFGPDLNNCPCCNEPLEEQSDDGPTGWLDGKDETLEG